MLFSFSSDRFLDSLIHCFPYNQTAEPSDRWCCLLTGKIPPLCTQAALKWNDKDIYVCLRLGYNNFADLRTFNITVSSIFWSDNGQSMFGFKAWLCFESPASSLDILKCVLPSFAFFSAAHLPACKFKMSDQTFVFRGGNEPDAACCLSLVTCSSLFKQTDCSDCAWQLETGA